MGFGSVSRQLQYSMQVSSSVYQSFNAVGYEEKVKKVNGPEYENNVLNAIN